MEATEADIVICGAGIAGIAAAHRLAASDGNYRIILVDERPPLSLTSDKSTECYRNWWPGPDNAMVRLSNHSIDLLEELARQTDNAFQMNRRGYLFATAENGEALAATARETANYGSGPLRLHDGDGAGPDYVPAPDTGYEGLPGGIDLISDRETIREHFPYLSDATRTVAHARRCGWLSAQQLGMTLLDKARQGGARLLAGRLTDVDTGGGRVNGVTVETADGLTRIAAPIFVNAAGPFAPQINRMLGVDLPITVEGHVKITFADPREAMPRNAPLVIWNDAVQLPWSDAERDILSQSEETRPLLQLYAPGVHGRPEGGGNTALLYWTYEAGSTEPVFPVPYDPAYPEIVLRGMSVMLPAMAAYFDQQPRPYIDGGYYTKTPENRPVIGPLPVEGAYITSAFSGFGIMMSMAAGDLLSRQIENTPLPDFAAAFLPGRYDDPAYCKQAAEWADAGEL